MFNNIEEQLKDNSAHPEDAAPIEKETDAQRAENQGNSFSELEFKRLYDSAFPILFRVALRVTNSAEAAEDLCQDSFFRLYEKNMVFPNQEEAKYWLIRVVKNAALNYAKRKGRERKAYQKAFKEDTRQVETGEAALVKKESSEEIQKALDKLPENLKVVLVMKEYAELNYKEIGRVLGISEGNVKVRVFRARERLSAIMNIESNKVDEKSEVYNVS